MRAPAGGGGEVVKTVFSRAKLGGCSCLFTRDALHMHCSGCTLPVSSAVSMQASHACTREIIAHLQTSSSTPLLSRLASARFAGSVQCRWHSMPASPAMAIMGQEERHAAG